MSAAYWRFLLRLAWRLDMAANALTTRTGRLVAAVHRRCERAEGRP
jgi:hypothetical protein